MNKEQTGMKVTTSIRHIKNQSAVKEFILVGLTNSPELQMLLFWLFTFIYAIALLVNFLLILTIYSCKNLHTPMYFLLINLSFVNMLSISATTPKMLQNLLTHRKTISFCGCMTQVYFLILALGAEFGLLCVMAFDRYTAICHPLQYTIIMRKEVCIVTASGAWVFGIVNSAVHSGLLLQLSFCNSNIIDHFYCDLPPLLKLSCSNASLNELMATIADAVTGGGSCVWILASYCFILRAIFRIRSTEGKKKAFSTCSSHLIVVSLYFSIVIYMYTRPPSVSSLNQDKVVSLFYSVLTPVLNPLIYTLRNKDFKEALRKLLGTSRLLQRPQDCSFVMSRIK
ncbi:olfactory receptor 13G1-like [Hemicordylus capensis]|uniref:olfactory receptor 13G1-like n=1 Tax=Hemicordylus capensis TaxID=884348 RepID=UPI0023020421|nr:olfactory receptor 13G1-like [Hemicordylus capensis]